jgi:two-component system copper resistance phosphate regulon response regulator CusR
MMKTLLVKDEQKTGDYLMQGLSEAGFMVDLIRDGIDGIFRSNLSDFCQSGKVLEQPVGEGC